MTAPVSRPRWRDVPAHRAANGINIKWIGCNDRVWDIGGYNEGAQGVIITGPISGMVHVPFTSVWSEPAYGPPRFERIVDERREISMRVMTMSDTEYGWFDTESLWWDGLTGDKPGWFCPFTRWGGEYYLPMQLLDKVETPLEVDPTVNGGNMQEWDILLAADGEPRWRQPDRRPEPWLVRQSDPTMYVKRDSGRLAPKIPVKAGKIIVANASTIPTWPVYVVSAPGRCWLPDGLSGRMIRVPRLYAGETCLIDTDPSHRIAISEKDPVQNWMLNILDNAELLKWLGIDIGQSSTETVLERFDGQGFTQPIPANTIATLPIYHSQVGARVSVRLPQRFERAIS